MRLELRLYFDSSFDIRHTKKSMFGSYALPYYVQCLTSTILRANLGLYHLDTTKVNMDINTAPYDIMENGLKQLIQAKKTVGNIKKRRLYAACYDTCTQHKTVMV